MRLYCIEVLNKNSVVDIQHMFADTPKDIHKRIDVFLEECKKCDIDNEYNGYKFHEVSIVDGININEAFKNYKIINRTIIKL